MEKNSTSPAKWIILITVLGCFSLSFTQGQTISPKPKFAKAGPVSVTGMQKMANYKFLNVATPANPEPVAYHAFDATLTNNKVNLFWITDAETGNDHFEVERSFNQTDFSTVGIILGAQSGDATSSQYSFRDGAPELVNHTEIYYRLKKVSVDEKFTYSMVKVIRRSAVVTKAFARVSPNPCMDKLNVNFVSEVGGKAEVRLSNVSGNLVKTTTSPITKGYNNIQLQDLQSHLPGLYEVNIIVNEKVVATLKVLKQ